MDKDYADRFRERKRRRAEMELRTAPSKRLVPEEAVLAYLEGIPDIDWLAALHEARESRYSIETSLVVSNAEVESLLVDLRGKVSEREFDLLLSSVNEQVLSAITKPFGLAKVLFQDRTGGNVTTIHNAKQGIYAKSEHGYDRRLYVNSKVQTKMNDFKQSRIGVNQLIQDGYTGNQLEVSQAETDHIKSIEDFHQEGGFMLPEERKAAFSSDCENFVATRRDLNRSKGGQSLKEFEEKILPGQEVSNKKRFDIDGRRTGPAAVRGDRCSAKHGPKTTEKTIFYAQETITTGASEALNMGLQQALGLLLFELADGVMVEVRELFRDWRDGELPSGLLGQLKSRLSSLGRRLIDKWDNVVSAFLQGGIAGFVSNLVTFIINCFKTTLGRVSRIIREGALSLLNAFKVLLFPPEGMTLREAAHESTKILVAGLALASGLAIEQFVGWALGPLPLLGFLAEPLVSILAGILTGVGTAMLVYAIDKIDFFGVNRDRQHFQVMTELEAIEEEAKAASEEYLRVFDLPELSPDFV